MSHINPPTSIPSSLHSPGKVTKCSDCQRKLEVVTQTLNEHEKMLYCNGCYQQLFQQKSDILVNDRRKMQVLPHGGKYDKKLEIDSDDEYRRREEAVLATRRAMAELAKKDALERQKQESRTQMKIKETVAICVGLANPC